MKKSQMPDIVIEKGNHTFITTNNHTGEKSVKWDWDKLLEEVQAATAGVGTKDIVAETEKKVRKTRKKKVAE